MMQNYTQWVKSNPRLFSLIAIGVILSLLLALGLMAFTAEEPEPVYNPYLDAPEPAIILPPETVRTEMEEEFNQAMLTLETLQAENDTLRSIIGEQAVELEAQRSRILKLLDEVGDLRSANVELDRLKRQTKVLHEMALEQAKNQALNAEIAQLKLDLEKARAARYRPPPKKKEEVSVAAALKVDSIEVLGQKIRSRGKRKKVGSAKRADMLQFCFKALENPNTEEGPVLFQFSIADEGGMVIGLKDEGFGRFTEAGTGETVIYTFAETIAYEKGTSEYCVDWALPTRNFKKGNYTVTIYNSGTYAGSGAFSFE